jgi:hypothetical protein
MQMFIPPPLLVQSLRFFYIAGSNDKGLHSAVHGDKDMFDCGDGDSVLAPLILPGMNLASFPVFSCGMHILELQD